MSNLQVDREPTAEDAHAIIELGGIRSALYEIKKRAEAFRNTDHGKAAAREISLLITEVQSARHWGGECLSHYPTRYRVTDNPEDPGSESQVRTAQLSDCNPNNVENIELCGDCVKCNS